MDNQLQSPFELNDEVLVTRVAQQDVSAFTALYDRYIQPIYAMATYLVGASEADEVVQEIFLGLWQRADQFDVTRGSFKSWFMALARYRMLDELRRRSRRQQVLVAEDIEQLLANTEAPLLDIEESVSLREEGQKILQALKTLPDEQRHVLVLAYFGGLSQSAISEHLAVPLGTVKKRVRLALQKLRIFWGDAVESPERTPLEQDVEQ